MNLRRLLLASLLLHGIAEAKRRPRTARRVEAQAARLYAEGMKLAAAGEHRQALERFTESYRLGSHPNALYNVAVCHEQLGDPAVAVTSYEQYLALPDPPDRESVQQRVDAIRGKPSRLTVRTTPPGANVIFGERVIASTPLGLDLPPGLHTLRVELTGHRPASFDVRAQFGLPLEKDVVLDPIPIPPPPPPAPTPQPAPPEVHATAPQRTPYGKIAAWSTVGAGAALIGVGAIFGVQARGAASDAQECEGQVPWTPSCFDALDRHDRLASRATLLIGLGTGLTLGGAVWTWFLSNPSNNDASVKAGIDKEEATLVYQTRF